MCVGSDGAALFFTLDAAKASLFDPSHQQRLTGVLSDYFDHPVKAEINLGELPSGLETPAMHYARIKQERAAKALSDIYQVLWLTC